LVLLGFILLKITIIVQLYNYNTPRTESTKTKKECQK